MKVLIVNSCCGCLSTGKIAARIAQQYIANGDQAVVAYARDFRETGVPTYKIGGKSNVLFHALASRVFDNAGFESRRATEKFLNWASEYKPDILWLHNLHSYYIDCAQLFVWIKRQTKLKVIWTLHDCWSFTGHCTHFSYVKCEKWKNGCNNCPQRREYPASLLLDRSKVNYKRKKELFTGIQDLTIIVPSNWLGNLVKESYLKDYPVQVVNNTIDESIFKPTQSSFREIYGLQGKVIVLGVANPWTPRKGLSDFVELSRMLSDDYKIVLVGLNEKQLKELPTAILGIRRTDTPEELAAIYSSADVFVNPTYEDNYPTTNLEAKACGTTVITYNTGGSVESVLPENIVPQGNINALAQKIKEVTLGALGDHACNKK